MRTIQGVFVVAVIGILAAFWPAQVLAFAAMILALLVSAHVTSRAHAELIEEIAALRHVIHSIGYEIKVELTAQRRNTDKRGN